MKKPTAPQILLILALVLAPLIGGQINTEATTLEPGGAALLRSIFSGLDSIFGYFVDYPTGASLETPTLSHAIIGLLIVAATILTVAKRQVFQVPFQRVSIPLIAFMVWLVCTLAFSHFISVSLVSISEWMTYGIVFFTVVACAGRRQGTTWIVSAIVTGCTVVGMKGLLEYGSMSKIDPTWRVFSTWANPTSLAGILAIGTMLAIGLAIKDKKLSSVVPWTCGVAMSCCIMVTDSRGGILSMLAGLVCLSGFVLFWLPKTDWLVAGSKVASILLLALLFGRFVHAKQTDIRHAPVAKAESHYSLVGQVKPTVPPPAIAQESHSVEQSSQFRILLWRGAIQLMKENGLGYGMGTYRYESARPGLTTETQLTHNTFLQIGVESGILGFLLFLLFVGMWMLEVVRGCFSLPNLRSFLRFALVVAISFGLFTLVGILAGVPIFPSTTQKLAGAFGFGLMWLYIEFFRKSPDLPGSQNILRAAIIAAVVCALAHSMLESGFYSYGIGITTFALLGLGLVQSADGVAPEYIPSFLRAASGVVAFVAAILLLHAGVVESLRARARYELAIALKFPPGSPQSLGAITTANEIVSTALNLAPLGLDEIDGETWRVSATVQESTFRSVLSLRKAASWAPNVRNLRALGMGLMLQQDATGAISAFNKALEHDPNNLLTLPKLRDAYVAAGQEQKAIETAQRTIEVEKTPYFQVRSLPQLVPVETYEARAFLAQHTQDLVERATLLQQAVDGYRLYLETTVPAIASIAQTDPSTQFGGENLALAQVKMATAAEFAKQLAETYRQLKRGQEEAQARQQEQRFNQAFAGFRFSAAGV